jgi:hypothetical protein
MKNNRLQKFESKTASEPSPEQIKQARETAVNMIMAVYDRMPKDNIQPVKESFSELARQAKEGVPRESTLIILGGDEKPIQIPKSDTLHNSGGEENSGKSKFTDLENALLEQIRNGE